MKTTRFVVQAAMIAALYAVLTYLVAPLSWGPLQFRVSEVLKGLVIIMGWPAVVGFTIGNFLSNIGSPYVGAFELMMMPLVNLIGASLAWRLRRWPVLSLTIYALLIAAGVGVVLYFGAGVPYLMVAPMIAVSELILIVGGWLLIWRREDIARLLRGSRG